MGEGERETNLEQNRWKKMRAVAMALWGRDNRAAILWRTGGFGIRRREKKGGKEKEKEEERRRKKEPMHPSKTDFLYSCD